jgi:hypothetical protein
MKTRLWQEVHTVQDGIALAIVLLGMGLLAAAFRWLK